ncbi:MAG: Mut7-C RNAse domain-containing protein [Proteobacteria bacterium]|nr:Mut7-C RNAse domain-containing protein [Pseudomonadota bacterium]
MPERENQENPIPRFAADCMLGKLAKWLRILGFDTAYSNGWKDRELLSLARAEGRVLLTRDTRLFRRVSGSDRVIFIENDSFRSQIQEVISHLNFLPPPERFFTRCSWCNHSLVDFPRGEARARVPDYVFETQESFAFCPGCERIYWGGTHRRMAKEILDKIRLITECCSKNMG